MDLPIGNFFQVTINSNKLLTFIDQMFKQIKTQSNELTVLSKTIHGMVASVEEKSRNQEMAFDLQLQKMRKGIQEEVNYVRLFMRDVDKKATDKISEIDSAVYLLKDKIVKTKTEMEEDIAVKLSYMDKRLGCISVLQEEKLQTDETISNLKQLVATLSIQLKEMNEHYEGENRKSKQLNSMLIERVNQAQRDFKNQNEQLNTFRTTYMQDGRHQNNSNNNKQKQPQNMKTQCFINIINRIDEVESNITNNQNVDNMNNFSSHNLRRSIISNNKVVKTGGSVQKSSFSQKKQNKYSNFQNAVFDKLAKIQTMSLERLAHFQSQIYRFTNKAEVVDEHIGILARKIEKQKFKIAEVTQTIKHFQDKKIDQRVIENIKNMIKKLAKDTEEGMELKVPKEVYEKEKTKFNEKIHFLNDLLIEKAEKADVKKGLTFFQQKIKQIILVLAEQRGNNQDGAIKRTPYKCLSCDKDLEADKNQQISRPPPKENAANLTRCNTNQMRKRIRMLNNTNTTNLNED